MILQKGYIVITADNVVSIREHQRKRLLATSLDLTDPEVQYGLFRFLISEWLTLNAGPLKVTASIFGFSIFEGVGTISLHPKDLAERCAISERRVRCTLRELSSAGVVRMTHDSANPGSKLLTLNLGWRSPALKAVRRGAKK